MELNFLFFKKGFIYYTLYTLVVKLFFLFYLEENGGRITKLMQTTNTLTPSYTL